jgi:glutathione peroxidase-family protein
MQCLVHTPRNLYKYCGLRSVSRSFYQATTFSSHSPSSCLARSQRPQFIHTKTSHDNHKRHFTSSPRTMSSASTFYDFSPVNKVGEPVPLSEYKGKVVLVVNTASKCGFTPQFDGLEKLYKSVTEKHPNQFTIVGFPCNQFGGQDPGSNDEIQEFCKVNYGVTFPIMGKIDVNGDKAAPVYEWMKKEKPGLLGLKMIKWNFEKFLIGADGKVKGRWASTTKPETLEAAIEKELVAVEKPAA